VPIALALATSGCATRKYVRNQVAPVNQKVDTLEANTNQNMAALTSKHDSDMSQVNERISTTDQRVAQLSTDTERAQGTASRAMAQAEANAASINAKKAAIANLTSTVKNAKNLQLLETENVTFGTNKSSLTPAAKAALDQVIAMSRTAPRSTFEVKGFTDTRGSKSHNLALSRKRAEAVQRYLVQNHVPLNTIHIIGMGEEGTPVNFNAEVAAAQGAPTTKAERHQEARRVQIRLFGAGETGGNAARSEPE
jgi:outer membrane protein OmpA-like peptidoglycan-associated protein